MKKHFETEAIRTQMERSQYAEHSSPLYLTSSFVFDNAEELRATLKQLNLIPHRFHVDLPKDLIDAVVKAKVNTAVSEIGVEWCTQQSKELKQHGVPFLHYYSMGKSKNVKKIASALF